MPRKRKIQVVEKKTNENELIASPNSTIHYGPMYTIMSNAQQSETFHKKYIREMQQLYESMDHDAFVFTLIKMIKSAMEAEESNEYAQTTLIFCAKYVSSYQTEDTHIILVDIFKWMLGTISQNPHIRFRLCQFVNMILNALGVEAALDDVICDNIMGYMIDRLRDINPNVRVQAILALQRLQCPDNPDDVVLRAYQFHLSADPSPKVRQSVITSMGRNYNTIPYILERLWDIDEKVRRHTYLHMSSYPVKAYKVVQRLTLLEQGMNDRSEMVRKVVNSVMVPQWLVAYNKNYMDFVSALKLDGNEAEVDRFRKIAKIALSEIFKRQKKDDIIQYLPFDEEWEFNKCIPYQQLTLEVGIYWQSLIEHLQEEMADEIDLVIPELSTFCSYVQKFCQSQKQDMDKFEKMEFQYILLFLMEIISTFDLGDEIGRENLQKLISSLIKSHEIEEKVIVTIIKSAENLFTEQDLKLQFFVDIIKEILDAGSYKKCELLNRELIEELLKENGDNDLKLKVSSLKVKLLDLEEQEMNYVEKKDYVLAHKVSDEINLCSDEIYNLLKPLMSQPQASSDEENSGLKLSLTGCFEQSKKITSEIITKCLQVCFFMVISKKVKSLTPNVCNLYKEFIRRHIESNTIKIREWALKCGTAYSLLYEPLSKDVYMELYSQFYKNYNIRIWKTSIDCIFELLDKYGFENFEVEDKQTNKSTKKSGRQLYNTLEFLDSDDDTSTISRQSADFVFTMTHFLDTCEDPGIITSVIKGFCRLVLHDHLKKIDIVEKLLLRYFNPSTDAEMNQLLGVFLENLIEKRKHEYLQLCLLPTLSTILTAPYESPLREIKPETVLRFVIDSTRSQFCNSGQNIHNAIAQSFLLEMQNNISNKDLCKILSKELLTLETSSNDDLELRTNLRNSCDKLLKCELDSRTIKTIISFKDILNGNVVTTFRLTNNPEASDEENVDEKSEDENSERPANEGIEKQVEVKSNENELEKSNTTMESNANDLTNVNKTPQNRRSERSPQKTPTTFGRENTTELRYLRKSMNVRESPISSHKDTPAPSPAKIRIETRIDFEGTLAKSTLPTHCNKDQDQSSNSKKSLTPNSKKGLTPNSKKSLTPNKSTTSSPKSTNEENLNTSEIISDSPTANDKSVIKKRKDRLQSTRNKNNQTQIQTRTRTTRQISQSARKEQVTEKRTSQKRQLRMTVSPRVNITEENETNDLSSSKNVDNFSPLRKQAKLDHSTDSSESVLKTVASPKGNKSPTPRNSLKNSEQIENEENITPPRSLSRVERIQIEIGVTSPIASTDKAPSPPIEKSIVNSLDKRKNNKSTNIDVVKFIRSTRNSAKKNLNLEKAVIEAPTTKSINVLKKVNVRISRIPVFNKKPSSSSTSSLSLTSKSTLKPVSTVAVKKNLVNNKSSHIAKSTKTQKGNASPLLRSTSDLTTSSKSESNNSLGSRIILTRSRTPKQNDIQRNILMRPKFTAATSSRKRNA